MPRTVSFIAGEAAEPRVEEHTPLVELLPIIHAVSGRAAGAVLHTSA